jgi:aryl-alcohol dehydrogenase-like predicted oxidoreductase
VSLTAARSGSPGVAVIPGTSSLAHLKQNIGALELPRDVVTRLADLG